jgi:hypothetical protein
MKDTLCDCDKGRLQRTKIQTMLKLGGCKGLGEAALSYMQA